MSHDVTTKLSQWIRNGANINEDIADGMERPRGGGMDIHTVRAFVNDAVASEFSARAATRDVPDYAHIVSELADRYPEEWAAAHTGGPDTEAFIRRLAWTLYSVDPRFGLNGKRGNPRDISDDVVCFDGFASGGDFDPTRGNVPVTVIDVIAGAGGPNPRPAWLHPLTAAAAAWVRPEPVAGPVAPPAPPVPPPPPVVVAPCQFQPFNLEGLVTTIERQDAQVDRISDDLLMLYMTVEKQRLLLADLIARMEQGFVIDANIKYLGAVRGTVRLPKGE